MRSGTDPAGQDRYFGANVGRAPLSDGKVLAKGRMGKTATGIIQAYPEGLNLGDDAGTP
jgi:hypothetical protein